MRSSRLVSFIALFIFIAGVINIISSLWAQAPTRIVFLAQFIPLQVSNLSRTITVIIGILLILVSKELYERKGRAWFIAILLLVPSLITHLIKGLDIEETVINIMALVVLVRTRHLFYVKSSAITNKGILKTIAITLFVTLGYIVVGYYALSSGFHTAPTPSLIAQESMYLSTGYGRHVLTPTTARARWFHQSISVLETASLIFIFSAFFAPFVSRQSQSSEAWGVASSLVSRLSTNSVSPLCLMSDKKLFFNADKTAFIAYAINSNYAVVLGDPIGYHEEIAPIIQNFIDYCHTCGLKAVWYNADGDNKEIYQSHNLRLISVGEEAVIDIPSFALSGSNLKDVRNANTKILKSGICFVWYHFGDIPWHLLKQIEVLHAEWIAAKNIPPMHFSVEYFPFPTSQEGYVLAGYQQDKLVCALSFFSYARQKKCVLDLMLKSQVAPNGIMESAIVEAINYFGKAGYTKLNLSLVPLASTDQNRAQASILKRIEKWYKFLPLRAFKNKFAPVWVPKYLVYQNNHELPAVLLSILRLHMGNVA
ncbi:MAG: phosphatidylglycerol lysyltransferase domain-containing protein [bacterium]